jgi:hypothetical protein
MFMRNLKMNFGGFFGAVVCAVAAGAILYFLADNGFPRKGYRLVFFALVGGAALGNWIWKLAQPAPIEDQFRPIRDE